MTGYYVEANDGTALGGPFADHLDARHYFEFCDGARRIVHRPSGVVFGFGTGGLASRPLSIADTEPQL